MDMICLQVATLYGLKDKYKQLMTVRPNYKDPSKDPTVTFKIREKEMETSIYIDEPENYMSTKDIKALELKLIPGKYMKCIIEVKPVWFSGNKNNPLFGISYELLAIKQVGLVSVFSK